MAARLTGLTAVVMLLWCTIHHKWTRPEWRVPLDYAGDSLEILARIKAAQEGQLVPFMPQVIERLGTPFGASWNDYPASDAFTNYALGLLARLTGIEAVSNIALLLAQVTAALSFYGCARLLRHRREWAFAGALLFAFAYFQFNRGLPHLWLTFTATVPLALLACWVVGGGGRIVRRRRTWWLCVGAAALLGASNPYNLFMFLQLLGWALLAALVRRRRPNWQLGLACVGGSLLMLGLVQWSVWVYARDEGATPLLVRNYAGTEIYALKPIELFLPPPSHHNTALASLGHRYVRWSDWRGETFSPYLGLMGTLGLLGALGLGLWRLLAARQARLPVHGVQALWILLFSCVGGINSILAFYGGLRVFRATNRYSVFLLALALFFLVGCLSRLTRFWPVSVRVLAAVLIVAVGLWDQVPRAGPAEARRKLVQTLAVDQEFGLKLEAQLGTGARVFQLPAVDFPEGRQRYKLNPLEAFRPYLVTSTLQFSFGAGKNRSKSRWQVETAQLGPVEMARALESYGFAAVVIDRRGYEDGGEELQKSLAAAGCGELTVNHPEYFVMQLNPVAHPRLPLALQPTFGKGWSTRLAEIPRARPRWANGSAALSYFNPYDRELVVDARLELDSPDARRVTLEHEGREVAAVDLPGESVRALTVRLKLRRGVNRFDLITARPPQRQTQERWRLRAFALRELEWRVQAPPENN